MRLSNAPGKHNRVLCTLYIYENSSPNNFLGDFESICCHDCQGDSPTGYLPLKLYPSAVYNEVTGPSSLLLATTEHLNDTVVLTYVCMYKNFARFQLALHL